MIMKQGELVTNKTLSDSYLRKFNSFLEFHSSRLIDILENRKLVGGDRGDTENNEEDLLISPTQHERRKKGQHSFVSSYGLTHNVFDIRTDPVQIVWGPLVETSSFEELTCSFPIPLEGNPDVQKVMLILVNLSSQLKEMTEYGWKNFVSQFILYGDGLDGDHSSSSSTSSPPPQSTSVTEGEGHLTISAFLPTLYHLKNFVLDVQALLIHCFQQISSLVKDSRPHVVSITNVNFPTFFKELGNLLTLTIVLDETISSQSLLTEHWTKYKRMINSVRADSENFDIDSESLLKLEKELDELDRSVLGGRIFPNMLFAMTSEQKINKRNAALLEKFMSQFTLIEGTLEQDFLDGSDELRPIAFIGLFVLVSSLLTFDAKKIFRSRIWPTLRKIYAVPIAGNLIWTPDGFLNYLKMGNQINFLDPKLLEGQAQTRHTFLESRISIMSAVIGKFHIDVHSWTIRLQELMYGRDISQLRREDLSRRSSCLIDGVRMAERLSHNFRIIVNLHAALGRPVTVQMVSYLIQHLELLKMIQFSFFRFNVQICHTVQFLLQTILHIGLTNVTQVKESILLSLSRSNRDAETKKDALSVICILENALKGPPSAKRILTAKLAFDWSMGKCFGEEAEKKDIIEAALNRIQNITELLSRIEKVCNGSAIYWHRQLFSTYFASIYANEMESSQLPTVDLILDDCLQLLNQKSPHAKTGIVQKAFLQEIESYVKGCVVDKLCTDVENSLRLQTHSHLQLSSEPMDASPFRTGVKDLGNLLELPSLVLKYQKANLKFIVEYYLSKSFYNLASVALHDWHSYAKMRVLAKSRYNLHVIQDHLPGHSLEQGLDVLAIVRTLKKFVTEFSYNLNNQVFIQVTSPNKHLETVSIRHLANSIRTHGLGMSNNTVNYAYQFLRVKIHSFSQFLFDEQIKSKLIKDLRTFKQGRQSQETTGVGFSSTFSYPYDKAQKFQKGIRKLGLTPDNLSPLDQFRILITQIGNTLGFVRLVVSAGRHFMALGSRFLTDLEGLSELENFIPSDETGNWKEELLHAAQTVDAGIKNLTNEKSPGIFYFNMLVSAFHTAFMHPSNAHMKNFFVIIPALTLSYVDHMRSCKEKLAKKSKSAAIFTDDGFAMGLAYLLKVLEQDADFDSLQWFSGVTHKLIEDRKQALQIIRDSKKDEKLQQASSLTAKRVQDILQEFHLLRYNLSSARIFFQQSLQKAQSDTPATN